MSQVVSRTSSQDTGESIVFAKQIFTIETLPAPQLKVPVKTALHQAVTDGRMHQARLLSDQIDNINTKDINGWTPLMLSCSAKKDKTGSNMMKMFLKKGAKINYRDKMGRTALMIACLSSNEQVVRTLLAEDALDLSIQDNDGNTALIHAAIKNNTRILNVMVDKVRSLKLSVDTRNQLGYTALLLSCKLGNFDNGLSLLINGNACPYIRDMEYNYCAKEWINWFRYKQLQHRNERERFPHLLKLNKRSLTEMDSKIPEEQTMKQLLRKVYKPIALKSVEFQSAPSLSSDAENKEDTDRQLQSMQDLKNEINRIDEEHEAERERLYLLQLGKAGRRKPRDISTAKLRRMAQEYDKQKYKSSITLPHIFTLYAVDHQRKWINTATSTPNLSA